MEQRILKTVEHAVQEAIVSSLNGYNSPLKKICDRVIEEHEREIYKLINDEFSGLINSDGFMLALSNALNQKLAKTLIGRMGGELESQVNKLKQNPETRAKITLAISNVISELTTDGGAHEIIGSNKT